ncbi:hypothetical protein OSTOST_12755 [Ostertagia ostertagi]
MGWFANATVIAGMQSMKSTSVHGIGLKTSGPAWGASIEAGAVLKLGSNVDIRPEVQLVYQQANLKGGWDAGAHVRFSNVTSLAARAGVRLGRVWSLSGDTAGEFGLWTRTSIWHDFKGEPKTEFSSGKGYIPFRSSIAGSSADLRIGANLVLNSGIEGVVSAGYQLGFDGRNHGYDGRAGIRFTW